MYYDQGDYYLDGVVLSQPWKGISPPRLHNFLYNKQGYRRYCCFFPLIISLPGLYFRVKPLFPPGTGGSA